MNLDTAISVVLSHEGGYVNDPQDPGGETKYGISKRQYPALDIENLSKEKAGDIYVRDYWRGPKIDKLPFPVALCVFDAAVNIGPSGAVKILQRVLGVGQDGIIGPVTLNATRSLSKTVMISKFTSERLLYYTDLKLFERYKGGWVRRTVEVMTLALRGIND